tara:strand:- start:1052 stop:2281 length:1230 start_codon:yes stop_codon:yes gene_type:complete
MSFATGFATGLFKSVDDQLKNDMLRTQKRMDGMEQYRVTRRRTDIEREQKETREVGDIMKNLASLVGGDPFKAAQLYEAGGGTIAGATEFYQTTKKSQAALGEAFDINTVVELVANDKPNDVSMSDYIKNYVRGVKTVGGNQGFEASGLLGKLFGSDNYSDQIDKRVNKAAPISEDKFGLLKVPVPKINHSEFVTAKKYEKENRRKYGTTYIADLISLEEELSNETDTTKKKALEAKIKTRRSDIITEAAGKNKGSKTSFFSKPNRDTIVKSAIDATMKKYQKTDINGVISIVLEGNEVDIFNNKAIAISNLKKTWTPAGDAFLNSDIDNQQIILQKEIETYKQNSYSNKKKRNKIFKPVSSFADAQNQTKPTFDAAGKIIAEAKIKKGDMIINPDTNKIKIWNGSTWI